MKLGKGLKAVSLLLLNVSLLLGTSTVAVHADTTDQIYSWPTILSKTESEQEILTKGVTYQHIHYETASGPMEVYETWTDLSDPNVGVKTVMSGDKLENDSNETVSNMANRTGAVEGTNGDYFEMSASGEALNMVVNNGTLIHPPSQSVVMGIDANNNVTIGKYTFSANVTATDGNTYSITSLNGHPLSYPNGMVLMTHDIGYWEMANNATVVTLQQMDTPNVYKVVGLDAGKSVIDCPYLNSAKLVAQGTAAISFVNSHMHMGDMITLHTGTNPDSGNLKYAIGGEVILLQNGQPYSDPTPPEQGFANVNMAMTGLGVTQDGKHMLQVVVDRGAGSLGLTYAEMTNYMKYRGIYNGMLFDGGGSSDMVVRQPGDTSVSVVNNPSDGQERHVANGLFIYSTSAPGAPTYVTLHDNQGIQAFRDTTVQVGAYVRDQNYNPLPNETVTYTVQPSSLGTITADGTFTAGSTAGTGTIVATASNGVTGQIPVSVYTTVDHLTLSPQVTDLGNGETQTLSATGTFNGQTINLNPTYLKWSISDSSLGSVSAQGVFTAASGSTKGTEKVTATIGSTSATTTIGVGYVQKTLDPLTDSSKWVRSNRWGEVGTLSTSSSQVQGGHSTSLAVNYSYPSGTDIRQFVFYPKNTLLIPSTSDNAAVNPIAVGAWVYGDNSGLKLLASFADPTNPNSPDIHSTNTVTIDWNGWKYVSFHIPAGEKIPLMLNYFDLLTDMPDNSTMSGHVYFSDLQTLYAERTYAEKPPQPQPMFLDVTTHWARPVIETLAKKGIVSGYNGNFTPDGTMTRAEAVSMIVKALNLQPQTATSFSDVSSDSWYAGAVGAAVNAGIINGVGDNKFAPDAKMDRNQAAVMIYNALKYKGKKPTGGTPISFVDASDIQSYAKSDIDALSAAGLMSGDGNKYLYPTRITTRAEGAALIYNMMKYAGLL